MHFHNLGTKSWHTWCVWKVAPGAEDNLCNVQAGAGALGALLGDTSNLAVPIRGPSSWGRGWAVTDRFGSVGPADSAAGMTVAAVTQEEETHMASSESMLHAAKRIRHGA